MFSYQAYGHKAFDPAAIEPCQQRIRQEGRLRLGGRHTINFLQAEDWLIHCRENLPVQSNWKSLQARDASCHLRFSNTFNSVGGDLVMEKFETDPAAAVPEQGDQGPASERRWHENQEQGIFPRSLAVKIVEC